jgi:hypothetical protein
MLYREIVAVCYEILTKHRNALHGKNVGLLNVETRVTEISDRAFSVAQIVECQYDWQLSDPVIQQLCYV